MILQEPFQTVTPSLDGEVLNAMAKSGSTFTVTWLEMLLPSRSPSGIRRVLDRLVRQGVIDEIRVGRALGYRLNTHHLATEAIVALASLRDRFFERLRENIASWDEAPVYVALFGSGAEGTMSEGSDIDLFFLRPAGASSAFDDRVHELAAQAQRWTGNPVHPLILDVDYVRKHGSTERVLADIADSAIPVIGDARALREVVR